MDAEAVEARGEPLSDLSRGGGSGQSRERGLAGAASGCAASGFLVMTLQLAVLARSRITALTAAGSVLATVTLTIVVTTALHFVLGA